MSRGSQPSRLGSHLVAPVYRGVVVTETGSYSRLIDSCITQLKVQGPSRTCNESREEEEDYESRLTTEPLRQSFGCTCAIWSGSAEGSY